METVASFRPMVQDELRALQAQLDLNRRIDDLVEEAMQARLDLPGAMDQVFPAICEATGARGAFIRTFNEDLDLTLLRHPADLVIPDLEEVLASTQEHDAPPLVRDTGSDRLFARALDVAGEWFGCAGILVPKEASEGKEQELQGLLHIACEQVDDFLFAIRAAREKHRVIMGISHALRHRVLDEGLRRAVRTLSEGVPFDRLLLVCATEEDERQTLLVQLFRRGELQIDTMARKLDGRDAEALRERARLLLRGEDRGLLEDLGLHGELEEVLINGIVDAIVVGKVFVTPRTGTFNTPDRDLLAGFAGFVRQRVIDFNKEWHTLSRSFRPDDVSRLLYEEHYEERFLAPREAEVAVMYADIAGFTRISEQVLRSPSAVGQLVETWSRLAVDRVWDHGGVFDKMVGDCIIALFGPPFFDHPPEERLLRAIGCAASIRDMTRALPDQPGFEHLKGVVLGVSCGLNVAPLFVGRFGSNDNFTGFSSGMNNTARLQGCADRDEILVMNEAIERLPEGHALNFGPERCARVKNVAHPIRFRALA